MITNSINVDAPNKQINLQDKKLDFIDNIEEKPVGNPNFNNFELMLLNYEDKTNNDNYENKALSFDKKIISKNWKLKQEALEEIIQSIKNEEFLLKKYDNYLTNIFDENHPANQALSLDIFKLLTNNKNDNNNYTSVQYIKFINQNKTYLLNSFIEKYYCGKHLIVIKDAIITLFEICDDCNLLFSSVFEKLIDTKSNAKILKSAINCCVMLLNNFGVSLFNLRSLNSCIEKVLNNTKAQQIKNECYEYYKELFKWTNQKGFINKLQECYKIDLQKIFSSIEETIHMTDIKPVKFNNNLVKNNTNNKTNKTNKNLPEVIDLDTNVPVKIFEQDKSQFNEAWINSLNNKSIKWIEKKEKLELAVNTCNNVKIANSNRHYLLQPFKLLLKDSNINVVAYTIMLIKALSNNLKCLYIESKEFLPLLLEKLKDNNKKIVCESISCIESFIISNNINLEEFKLHIEKSLSNNNFIGKENTLKILHNLIDKNYEFGSNIKCFKNIINGYVFSLTEDSSNEVRSAAFKLIAFVNHKVGKDVLDLNLINNMNDVKRKKFDEYLLEYTTNNTKKNNNQNIDKKVYCKDIDTEHTNNTNTNCIKINNKSNTTNDNNKIDIDIIAIENNEDDNTLTIEEVEEYITKLMGNEIISLSNSNKWDERKQSLTLIKNYICSNKIESNECEIFYKFINTKLKNFKENNFNLIKEAIEIFEEMINKNILSKKLIFIISKKIIDKWGDIKLKVSINSFFNKFKNTQNSKHLLSILTKYTVSKSSNIIKECCQYIINLIEESGINQIPIKEVINFAKTVALNNNQNLRTSAINIFCCLYKFLGDSIKSFFKDGLIKEATIKVIESEFDKIKALEIKNQKSKNATDKNNLTSINNNKELLNNLFPKIDISKKITNKMIKDFNEAKYPIKKEVLDNIAKIISIEAHGNILPNGLSDLIISIKNKLLDGNKIFVRTILSFLSVFFEALGKDSKVFSKSLLPGIISNLSDKNNLLREDAVNCLNTYINQDLFISLIMFIPNALIVDNFESRSESLKLIIKHKDKLLGIGNNKYDYKELVPSLCNCLMDKTPFIRNLTEELIKHIYLLMPVSAFDNYISNNFKPAQQSHLKSILKRFSNTSLINCEKNKDIDIRNNNKSINQDISRSNNENALSKVNNNLNELDINSIKIDTNVSKLCVASNYFNSESNKTLNISNFLKTQQIKPKQKQIRISIEQDDYNFKEKIYSNEKQLILKDTLIMYFNDYYINELAFTNDWNKLSNFFSLLKKSLVTQSFYFFEVLDLIIKWIAVKNNEMNLDCFFNNSLFEFLNDFFNYLNSNEFDLSCFEVKLLLEILTLKLLDNNSTQTVKDKSKKFIIELSKFKRFVIVDYYISFFSFKIINNCNLLIKKLEFISILKEALFYNKIIIDYKFCITSLIQLIILKLNNSDVSGSNNTSDISCKFNNEVEQNIILNINTNIFYIIENYIKNPKITIEVINSINDNSIKNVLLLNLKDFLKLNQLPESISIGNENIKSFNNSKTLLEDNKDSINIDTIDIKKTSSLLFYKSQKNIIENDNYYIKQLISYIEKLNFNDNTNNLDFFEKMYSSFNSKNLNYNFSIEDVNIIMYLLSTCLVNIISCNNRIIHYNSNIKYILIIILNVSNNYLSLYPIYSYYLYENLLRCLSNMNLNEDNYNKLFIKQENIITNTVISILTNLLDNLDLECNCKTLIELFNNFNNNEININLNSSYFENYIKCFNKLSKKLKNINNCNLALSIIEFCNNINAIIAVRFSDYDIPKNYIFEKESLNLVKRIIFDFSLNKSNDIVKFFDECKFSKIKNLYTFYYTTNNKTTNNNFLTIEQSQYSTESNNCSNSLVKTNIKNILNNSQFKTKNSKTSKNSCHDMSTSNCFNNNLILKETVDKINNAFTKSEKEKYCFVLFNIMDNNNINNLNFLNNKIFNISDQNILLLKQLYINFKNKGILSKIEQDKTSLIDYCQKENNKNALNKERHLSTDKQSKIKNLELCREKFNMLKENKYLSSSNLEVSLKLTN